MPVDSTFAGPTLPDQHYDDETLIVLLRRGKAVGGAITFNVPVSAEGHIPEKMFWQMQRAGKALRSEGKKANPASLSTSAQ